jgi:hypothetical protein
MSESKTDVFVVTDGGEDVVGRLQQPDPDALRARFGITASSPASRSAVRRVG